MTSLRYSRWGAGLAFSTLLLGLAFLVASFSPGSAAPATAPAKAQIAAAGSSKAKIAAVDAIKTDLDEPATTGSTKAPLEGGPGCQRLRRKLWVDGEGWIVRRVTLCP